jgi:hypothetical protein
MAPPVRCEPSCQNDAWMTYRVSIPSPLITRFAGLVATLLIAVQVTTHSRTSWIGKTRRRRFASAGRRIGVPGKRVSIADSTAPVAIGAR